jgi:hypothetical protein
MAGRVSSVGAVGTARVGPPGATAHPEKPAPTCNRPTLRFSVKALKGGDEYRLRVGDWRVVYTLHDDVLTVLVVRIAHRREVYR